METLVRLSAAKRTLGEGVRHGRRGDEVGRVVSVLLCDLAAETAMKTVALSLGKSIEKLSFPDLVAILGPRLPSAPTVRDLRSRVRNPAQHGAAVPRPADVEEMIAAATRCVTESCIACGHDYMSMTLVPLIANPTLRAVLDDAVALAASDPRASLRTTARGFRWLEHVTMFMAGVAYGVETWWSYDPRSGLEMEAATADGRAQTSRELLTMVAGAALGLDIPRRLHLVRLLGSGRDDVAPSDVSHAWEAIEIVAAEAYRIECAVPEVRALAPGDTEPTGDGARFFAQWARQYG